MTYIHGFNEIEQARLVSQAAVLEDKIFKNIDFKGATKILEIGSGVGAQTEILLKRYPEAHITGVELSEVQLNTAKSYIGSKFDKSRYSYYNANAETLPFENDSFDAVYICWVLEHVPNPQRIIDECFRVLKPKGIITISEVQNNNLWLIPKSEIILNYWNKYNDLQLKLGGNPFVGVEIGNFIYNSGFKNIETSSRNFLYDNSMPNHREMMVDYWLNLLLSGFDNLLKHNKVKIEDKSIIVSEMKKVSQVNGVFNYAFIQSTGKK